VKQKSLPRVVALFAMLFETDETLEIPRFAVVFDYSGTFSGGTRNRPLSMSTLTARDGRAECISVAQLMFLERSRAFYFKRCSRVASSNTRITKHFRSEKREEKIEEKREFINREKKKVKRNLTVRRRESRTHERTVEQKVGANEPSAV
jgi:hypothetical protein